MRACETQILIQIFRQFIEDRLQMLNDGKVGSDGKKRNGIHRRYSAVLYIYFGGEIKKVKM